MKSADVILDLSRLLSRVRHHTPSGVDRVEMAYARGLLEHFGDQLQFAAVHPFGLYGRLPREKALRFLDAMEQRWTSEDGNVEQRALMEVLPSLLGLLPERPRGGGGVYVQASPHHLTKPTLVRRILEREGARFLCLVHDLIPIEYPEYARPNGAALHTKRIETVTALADGIIVNSTATGVSLKPWLKKAGRTVDMRVALLGTHPIPESSGPAEASARPYFVCIGTIEARKNHLLLLNLWRHMAETQAPDTIPKLIIVGRRGWENEQVVDMLERCAALQGACGRAERLFRPADARTAAWRARAAAAVLRRGLWHAGCRGAVCGNAGPVQRPARTTRGGRSGAGLHRSARWTGDGRRIFSIITRRARVTPHSCNASRTGIGRPGRSISGSCREAIHDLQR